LLQLFVFLVKLIKNNKFTFLIKINKHSAIAAWSSLTLNLNKNNGTFCPFGHWVIGSLGHWVIGSLGHWVIGSLGHWDLETTEIKQKQKQKSKSPLNLPKLEVVRIQ